MPSWLRRHGRAQKILPLTPRAKCEVVIRVLGESYADCVNAFLAAYQQTGDAK